MATLDRLFQADLKMARLTSFFFALALELVVLAKATGHFVVVVLPLLLAVPLAGILLNIEPVALPSLMAALSGRALACVARRDWRGSVGHGAPRDHADRLAGHAALCAGTDFRHAPQRHLPAGMGANAAALGVLALFGLAALLLAPVAIAAALCRFAVIGRGVETAKRFDLSDTKR